MKVQYGDACVDPCEELLRPLEAEGDGFLSRIVTGDETWVHYHQQETKRTSKEWRHSSSPKPKKFRRRHLQGRYYFILAVSCLIFSHF
jgi:hypothetical protein